MIAHIKTRVKQNLDSFKGFNLVKWLKQFEEENLFLKWYDAQPISAKTGFYGAAIIAFLTHIIAYSNLILEEHLPGFANASSLRHAGRWFHRHVNSLSFFHMNWVSGLLQILFLALTVFIIIKAFNIKNKLNALLIAGIMVTFPAIAETNLHFHDAAPYFFAAFLCIAAFYITKQYKFGWLFGTVLITLGLAIYQSKISLAMVAILVHLIIYVLKENPKLLGFIKYAAKYFIIIAGGLIAYHISLRVLDIPAGYRGIGELSLPSIYNDILRAYREVYYYFFSGSFRIDSNYLLIAYGFIMLMGLLLIVLAAKKAAGRNILNIILLTALALLLPLAANFSRIFDTGHTGVLTMVTYAFTMFLILPLIMFENFSINTYGLKKIMVVALIFIIGYYISFSNFIYQRGQVITMHTMQHANRISARVEPLLPYSDNNQFFPAGNLEVNPLYPNRLDFQEYTPRTTQPRFLLGGNNEPAEHWPYDFFVNVIRHRVGLDVTNAGDVERRQYLLDMAITYGMPVYPHEGSVAIIDGVVVAILNYFGRIDVEETAPNSFIATINHTGRATDLEFEYAWYLYKDGQRVEQIHQDYYGMSHIHYEINEPGSYQFRVFIRLSDGRDIIYVFSPDFEIE